MQTREAAAAASATSGSLTPPPPLPVLDCFRGREAAVARLFSLLPFTTRAYSYSMLHIEEWGKQKQTHTTSQKVVADCLSSCADLHSSPSCFCSCFCYYICPCIVLVITAAKTHVSRTKKKEGQYVMLVGGDAVHFHTCPPDCPDGVRVSDINYKIMASEVRPRAVGEN